MANKELQSLNWHLYDLDDTLAKGRPMEEVFENPNIIGDVIPENLAMALTAIQEGKKIVVYTARPWDNHPLIEKWMSMWGIPFEGIICGKPLAGRMVDDRAVNPNCNECRQRYYDELNHNS